MEEVGIKPKRVAGASAGAIASLLVALGYNPQQIYAWFQQDMSSLLLGNYTHFILHSCYEVPGP